MPLYRSLSEVQAAIQSGKTNCVQLVDYYLGQIEAHRSLNAYVEVYESEARQRARELDAQYQTNASTIGRLHGMVISIKDVLCYQGHQVTAASAILQGFEASYSATAIERLLAEGAIIIGRVNCDQFAMGSTNENSHYGPVRNAADPTKVPGGSSGGSAVSVQADTCLASLGSDTGGSVRQPAAFCGIVGMKPTYGRISRHGLLAYASSFDQIGTLTHSVADAALLLEIMAGADDFDSTASRREVPTYSDLNSLEGPVRIAYIKDALEHPDLNQEVQQQCLRLIEQLRAAGHVVEAVNFEYLDYIIPAYYVLTTAEASSNLSRYDGIRYGRRSESASNLAETYLRSRTEGFSEEVKRRIMLGTFVLSSGYYDAYYTKAQKVRRLIRARTTEILQDYHFILMPASPGPAWNLGERLDDPVAMYLADIFTVQANMAGIPAICLPYAQHQNGMFIGIQLMANAFEEQKLLRFAHQIQSTLIS
ncbi:MAG: Asp-tRNA(Asn)/Glu-tRNA(Gln) amidotransferase subunit GatA [Bacteroidota bacterium]